jgi:hypothetical protein
VLLPQRLVGYLAGDNEDSVKLPPTVPLNSMLLTADRASETVKGHFYFAIYLPEEVQVGHLQAVRSCLHVTNNSVLVVAACFTHTAHAGCVV